MPRTACRTILSERCIVISFFVPGKITGKERPRFGKGNAYTASGTRALERSVGYLAKEAMRGKSQFTGPVMLEVEITVEPPKSWKEDKRETARHCMNGADLDNQIKLIGDAINSIVYFDDRQITTIQASKHYSLTKPAGARVCIHDLTRSPFTKAK